MILSLNKEEFTEQYLNCKSIEALAEQYRCSEQTIKNWAKKLGISRKLIITKEKLEKVLAENNISQLGMIERLKCSYPTFKKYMKLYELDTTFTKVIPINMDDLYRLRVTERKTYRQIAKLYGVSDTTLRNRCEEFDFPPVNAGRKTNTWKLKPINVNRKKKVNKIANKKLKELYALL